MRASASFGASSAGCPLVQLLTVRSVQKLCPGLNTENKGCIRYTRGFDVTGVVTEVDLTFPQIQSACDCIQQCLDRPTTCAAWVYKFSTPASVLSGHRTCTLYSQFNLPTDVTIEVDTAQSVNFNLLLPGNNPQAVSRIACVSSRPNTDANLRALWSLRLSRTST